MKQLPGEIQPLLERFISSFQKAIRAEMEAMRQRLGPFEVPLTQGRSLDPAEGEPGRSYVFKVLQSNDKLVPQLECTLRYNGGEILVTITDLRQEEVTVRADRPISLSGDNYTLVIYPWFLYEKLQVALESLVNADTFFPDKALLLFGYGQPGQDLQPLQLEHPGLNDSQLQAVQLCSDSTLVFVWGPPGTGKTTTLGHIVTELLNQGQRLLVTSTTNAAVDQALAHLNRLPEAQTYFERGQMVRIGQTGAETFGASLKEVVKRLNSATQVRMEYLRERRQQASRQIKQCDLLLERLQADTQPQQLDLFQPVQSDLLAVRDLTPLFSEKLARTLLPLPGKQQQVWVAHRRQRLETVLDLCRQQTAQLSQELRQQEVVVVQKARVILATMTNVYLSSLLQPERFDVVIVEEAGMAILPTLFYCAALARAKIIVVGDPQQLPPIVQAHDDYVYRAMGRTIFEVADQKSLTDETMVMLDIQYRMHPVIGDLVSRLFYQSKLRHAENTLQREAIAGKPPFPGAPLVVLDTAGRTTCTTEPGGFSRFNEKTAHRCVELAVEAVRVGIQSVAIITPYVAQSRLIRQQLARFPREAGQVECRTVHRFQGNERDLVILDTVDTAPLTPGVLLTDQSPSSSAKNLLNVSLSRARGKLVIIADVAYFNRAAPESLINELLAQAIQAGVRASF
jgi:molybdopterin-guanine dinucleotide biosynthesis protein